MDKLTYQLEIPESKNVTLAEFIHHKKSMVVFVRHLG